MLAYDHLIAQTEPDRIQLQQLPLLQRAATGQGSLDSYIAFLTQAYHHVKETVPLLMACGAALPPRLNWLRADLAHYIGEEIGHEEWVLNDITACGGNAERVRNGTPHSSTELMVAYAWDTISRGNPVGFLGMVLVLEGTSVALATQVAGALQKSLQLPDSAFTYLRSHGELDLEHVDDFAGLVNRIDHPDDLAAIEHCARVFYHCYAEVFRSIPLD